MIVVAIIDMVCGHQFLVAVVTVAANDHHVAITDMVCGHQFLVAVVAVAANDHHVAIIFFIVMVFGHHFCGRRYCGCQ